jgi:ABC-type enterochelin transport system permease subunit
LDSDHHCHGVIAATIGLVISAFIHTTKVFPFLGIVQPGIISMKFALPVRDGRK